MVAARELLDAYLLHRRPYLGRRHICEFFTRENGRIAAVASSRSKGALEPFTPLLISLRGSGELSQLTALEPAPAPPQPLCGTLSFCGLYLNELLVRILAPHDPHPPLYDRYQITLQSLSKLAHYHQAEPILRAFELELLDDMGFGLALDQTADGQALAPEQNYAATFEEGLQPVAGGMHAQALIFPGRYFLAIARRDFESAEVLRAAKYYTRASLAQLLGARPLKSRELFQ